MPVDADDVSSRHHNLIIINARSDHKQRQQEYAADAQNKATLQISLARLVGDLAFRERPARLFGITRGSVAHPRLLT
ncbi:MAG: hypothetical protein AVDCRST_MAG26-939 [uncultured Chloroflexia bacterium]|uniref:Uncharacterized protein n=1 Tax=uncultured Chloroflexia bacterium TaxID=1672391 RepID=A0A6J4HQY7_9CHLR|nr:MAG: hypothetical protein AVDCRST_MAG26-939 [uncultured Chloroflexia bacterium]